MQPHPLTCISSGNGEHRSNILIIMLELITQRLPNGGWGSPIDSNMLMLLLSKNKDIKFLGEAAVMHNFNLLVQEVTNVI